MTGRYNYRTRAIDTYLGRAMLEPQEVTLAEALASAGYATGIFGKWHLGDSYPMRPQDEGFQEVLVHWGGGIGQPSDPPGGEGKYTDPLLFHNGVETPMKGYCTDVYFDHAMRFLEKNHRQQKPSFVYLPTNAPHGPFGDVPGDLLNKYRSKDLRATYDNLPKDAAYQRSRDQVARIFAMIENIDQNVGRLFDFLGRIGADENTLVFFLTDNGPNGPRFVGPHRGRKGSINEGGIRTVLLAHWPGHLKGGHVSDQIAAHYDLFPTILEATGTPISAGLELDGRSILRLLKGDSGAWRARTLFLQWHRGDAAEPYRNGAAVTQQYKLLWTNSSGRPKAAAAELYDLINDPAEQHNLATQKPGLVKQLSSEYTAWFKDVSSTRPDNYAPPRIHIGNPQERTTVLTRQDWRFTGSGNGWARNARGHWVVDVERQGAYEVKVLFTAEPKAGKLWVRLGQTEASAAVPANATQHVFKDQMLMRGPSTIHAGLEIDDLKKGVHQIYIKPN